MTTETRSSPRPLRFLRGFAVGLWRMLDATRRAIANLLLLILLLALVIWLVRMGPAGLQDKTTLVVQLEGTVLEQEVDARSSSALSLLRGIGSSGPRVTRLRDLIAVLDAAARDDKITQLLLLPEDLSGGGLPTLREVAAAIDRFKASGKKVVAWAGGYDQRQYFLAARADEVWMHPMGGLYIEGYGGRRSYYKEALDRLGIKTNVVRTGAYKNAGESYVATGPSPETLETDRALYGAFWSAWTEGVERARKLGAGAAAAYVEGLPGTLQAVGGDAAQLAVKSKFVDALKTRDEMRELLAERGARDEKNKTFRQVSFGEYLARVPAPARGDGIGVIVAQGEISDGRAGAGRVGGLSTAELIRRAREDEQIKAIVLRVNSPGGSAFGSELVRRELELVRKAGKPVVVSMGDLAASGGYWISMAADEIIADETTITGSIGVVAMLTSAQGAAQKLGVNTAGTTTTWLAGAADWRRDPEPRFIALLQSWIDHSYADFLGLVAAQRKLSLPQVQAVAQGRAWSGKDAKARGLVDRLGSFGDAIEAAATRAKLPKTAPVRYFEVQPGRLQRLLQGFGFAAADAAAWAQFFDAGASKSALPSFAALATLAAPDFGWLIEAAEQRKPFVAAAYCFCEVP
jgi:protease-4